MIDAERQRFGGGQSSQLVECLCREAGQDFKDPTFTTREVLELLDALGYKVEPATVARFIRLGYIPAIQNGTFTHEAIHRFVAALEARRYWQPGSRYHLGKFSAAEQEYARFSGNPTFLRELCVHSLEDLLLMMVAEQNLHLRECLLVSIRHKLKELGVEE
jgi:hypothetical protein